MSYAELYCQSNFSFLTGASHPQELVMQASFYHYEAIAITDECSVAGVVRAYAAIKENNLAVKLIVGSLFRYEGLEVVLICPNSQAYSELCRIITNSRRRSPKGEYKLSQWDLMSVKHCIVLFKPSGDSDNDNQWLTWLKKYHQDRLYIAYQRHLNAGDHHYQHHCEQLAKQFTLTIVACGGVLMHSAKRLPLQHTLSAIRQGTSVEQLGTTALSNAERALRPLNKLVKLYNTQWLTNTLQIARLCTFELGQLRYQYPDEVLPQQLSASQYLRQLVERGITLRFKNGVSKEIRQIIEKELVLIAEQQYEYFFLTVYDIVQFAKRQGILYQGRGSAANSIVCYCLEITAVDPRQISVLFERFISKERNEPPDIDVDFEHQRREEIFQYIYQKYGRERAALTATVIRFRLKSAIREVGKALGFNQTQLDFFIKNLNRRDKNNPWQQQLAQLGLAPDSPKATQFIRLVNEVLGFPRHLSQHVGGFIISQGPLYELVPIENAAMDDRTVIQWDKDDLQTLGLLKVDVLALGMLSAIQKAFALISHHYQHDYTIADITKMPDDPQVYSQIQAADTIGVFQIESRAQMSMLPRLKPRCYYDLVIQIAIVRPGPIQGDMVHPYLKRREGLEPVNYPSAEVKSVLERTLGVPIFQEQVIKLAMVAAGFSGGEADQLRRAMAKWQRSGELNQFKDKLINGMSDRGYTIEFAQRIFKQICGFGEYGFPESHSASFAVLAYVSAWLKCYYPAPFYCALLNSHPMGFYSPSQLVQDARRHGVVILAVNINSSQIEHHLVKHRGQLALHLGLRLIKGLSSTAMRTIIAQRPSDGYRQLAQVKALSFSHHSLKSNGLKNNGFNHNGLKHNNLNRKDLEALASSGALSNWGDNRYTLRWLMMDNLNELPLFQTMTDTVAAAPNYLIKPTSQENLVEDYRALGLSLTNHPIALLRHSDKLGRYTPAAQLSEVKHKSMVTVIGVVSGRQSPGTASGVTFVTLEDDTGQSNVIVWQATANAQKSAFLRSKILKVTGIFEREGDVCHIIAGKLTDLSHLLSDFSAKSRDFH